MRRMAQRRPVGLLGCLSLRCDSRSGSLQRMVRRCGHYGFGVELDCLAGVEDGVDWTLAGVGRGAGRAVGAGVAAVVLALDGTGGD